MIRVSNKQHPEKEMAKPQVHYVDRVVEVEVPVEQQVIQYIDRPVETVVVEKDANLIDVKEWCQQRIEEQNVAHALLLQDHKDRNNEKTNELENKINIIVQRFNEVMTHVGSELEMQRRAFIAVKIQRDVDRKRRLMFIKRVRKEQKKLEKQQFILKCALCASCLLTVISFFIKL